MSRALTTAAVPRGTEPSADAIGTTQTEWSRVLAHTLRDAGVTQVVASPGSRSTPILAALLSSGLQLIDVVDERSAAFVALGYGRATGRPAAVLCTSGTAPAHWFPAVLEASLVDVPMVLVSADRPTELSLCGAAQTVDQVKLFGAHVRFFADTGNPEAEEGALAGLRRVVAQAVATSLGPQPGPVHLNVRAKKPLEPREPSTRGEHALRATCDAVLARPIARPRTSLVADESALDALASRLTRAERVLFVAGPIAPGVEVAPIVALVERCHGVLAAESTSQLRFSESAGRLDSLDAWLTAGLFADEPSPDLVVELGGVPTSAAYERWVSRARPARVVLGVPRYVDPHASAEQIVLGELASIASALLSRLPERAAAAATLAFRDELARLDAVGQRLAAEVASRWGEPAIARTVAIALPTDARLVIGNSLPIRMLDRYATRDVRTAPLSVLHQRGANGIDGLLAQSLGAILGDPRPTLALVGDLTLLHDVGSLAIARKSPSPLVIVVVDNAGGRIFEGLPVAREAAWMMPHMVTSELVDHEALARAFGVAFERAATIEALEAAITRGLAKPGLTLVHAVVEPHAVRALEAELARGHTAHLAERRKERRWTT